MSDTKYKDEVAKAYEEVRGYFDFDIEDLKFIIATSRKEYDEISGKKSQNWMVGTAISRSSILALDPEVWGTEATKDHNPKDFPKLLKHEITHLFTGKLAGGSSKIPRWLNEGMSCYIAGQSFNFDPQSYKPGFLKEMATPEDWNERVKRGAYAKAAAFVRFLGNKFGFEKIKELVKNLPEEYSYGSFCITFEDTFKIPLEKLEGEFIAEQQK